MWGDLEPLMQAHPTDYTIFWRRLADAEEHAPDADDDETLVAPLAPAFYRAFEGEYKV